ncbi:MAG: VanZ family protein [Candidatus Neomarinimicrobiota bacterium]
MSKKVFRIILILYLFVILALSTIPGEVIPKFDIFSIDKLLHIIEYFILAFLAINAIKIHSTKIIIWVIFIGIAYGGFNEIWQGLIATRFASVYDAIANGIGMIIGSIVTYKYLLLTHD